MVIERLTQQYIAQVVGLQKTLVPFELPPEEAAARQEYILSNPDYVLLVAREGDAVLGTVTGICCRALSMPFLVIEDVVVREDCRGNGIGKQLMDELDRFALEKKCEYAILVSSGFRKEAHKFYEKQGFTEDVRGFRKGYHEHD